LPFLSLLNLFTKKAFFVLFIENIFNFVKKNFNFIKMKLPVICPSCENLLRVSQMKCDQCQTDVNGNYELPLYFKLAREEQDFILEFFLSSGSIKEMAKQAGNSYPTMRNKMDDLIEKINQLKNPA
jgi:hypothetical protein